MPLIIQEFFKHETRHDLNNYNEFTSEKWTIEICEILGIRGKEYPTEKLDKDNKVINDYDYRHI